MEKNVLRHRSTNESDHAKDTKAKTGRTTALSEVQLTPTEAAWKAYFGADWAAKIPERPVRETATRENKTEQKKPENDSSHEDDIPSDIDAEWEALRVASGWPPRDVKGTSLVDIMIRSLKYHPFPNVYQNPEKEPLFGIGTEFPPSNSHSFNVKERQFGVHHHLYPLGAARTTELLEGQPTPTEAAWNDHAAAIIALILNLNTYGRENSTEPNKTVEDSCREDRNKISDTEWETLRVASGFPPRDVKNTELEAAAMTYPLPSLCPISGKELLFGAGTEFPPPRNYWAKYNRRNCVASLSKLCRKAIETLFCRRSSVAYP